MLYGLLKRGLLGPALHVVFRPQAEGVEHIPASGPVLLVANHQSFSDSIFMPLLTPRPVKFLAKAEYFTGRGVKGWFSKGFFSGVGLGADRPRRGQGRRRRDQDRAAAARRGPDRRALPGGHPLAGRPALQGPAPAPRGSR